MNYHQTAIQEKLSKPIQILYVKVASQMTKIFLQVLEDLLGLQVIAEREDSDFFPTLSAKKTVLGTVDIIGTVVGSFGISMDEQTLSDLLGMGVLPALDERGDIRQGCGDFLKEVLNQVSAPCIKLLQPEYDVTLFAPKVIYGEAQFPKSICIERTMMTDHGEFYFYFYLDFTRLDLADLAKELTAANSQLLEVNEKLQQSEKLLRAHNETMQEDLALAVDFQQSLLPKIPRIGFLQIVSCYIPYSGVSGDIYDISLNREGDISIFLGDATGHGIAAAFMTMMVQIGLDNIPQNFPVHEVMHHLNMLLSVRDTGKSLTSVFVRVSQAGALSVAQAGHPPLILIPADESEVTLFEEGGLALGLFKDEPIPYVQETCQLKDGDKFFIYTDGIIEWENENKVRFGVNRLVEFFKANRRLALDVMLDALMKHLHDFSQGIESGDDVSILGFQFME
ncbi:MAG: SpoIIE family protein phosphatase [SAR324 cluster bacterium]|nr:SpoIIE family protein phosphatase [SAR324 cluster bacterium]